MADLPKQANVVVIGGGVIGCSIAYHLGRRGVSARVVDRESIATRASGKAWAVGHFGTVLHSPDGGLSWKVQEFEAEFPEGTPEAEMGVISDAAISRSRAIARSYPNRAGGVCSARSSRQYGRQRSQTSSIFTFGSQPKSRLALSMRK